MLSCLCGGRLTGFVPITADASDVPSSNVWGSSARHSAGWRAVREYYQEYLHRAMPPAAPPAVCRSDLATFKAVLAGVLVEEALVFAIAPGMVGRGPHKKISLLALRRFLGHDRLTTSEIYLNLSTEDVVREFRDKR